MTPRFEEQEILCHKGRPTRRRYEPTAFHRETCSEFLGMGEPLMKILMMSGPHSFVIIKMYTP